MREHYNIQIELISPDHTKLEPFVKEKGLFSFYKDGHGECCGVRMIEPLRRKLSTVKAWATGQRRDQSPGTRSQVAALEIDGAFSTPERPLYKFNPLAQMTSEEVWGYIRMLELPYNSLHERGYISIGCEPCTRPVLPNQHEREGLLPEPARSEGNYRLYTQAHGDKQAEKEMTVFLKKLDKVS